MSKKYFDKLMTGTGSTTKTVKSKFGSKLMESMGWSEGKGIGKNEDGMKECIQITRREDGVGLGQEEIDAKKSFKWNDAFWDNVYNKNLAKFATITGDGVKTKIADSDSSSSDGSDNSDSDSESNESTASEISINIITKWRT